MYVDKKIGQLVDLLEEEGWMDNSIIVVSSDNGGHPEDGGSNYPLRGRKNTYWDGGCKARPRIFLQILFSGKRSTPRPEYPPETRLRRGISVGFCRFQSVRVWLTGHNETHEGDSFFISVDRVFRIF